MLTIKGKTFGVPIRPKYMRKKRWNKYLEDNDLLLTGDKLNKIFNQLDFFLEKQYVHE